MTTLHNDSPRLGRNAASTAALHTHDVNPDSRMDHVLHFALPCTDFVDERSDPLRVSSDMRSAQRSRFDHVERLSDERGLFEHASGLTRREEHGYCTDDNARLLIITAREADTGPPRRLGRIALRFVLDAQALDGQCHNRMNSAGCWTDVVGTDDCWGYSVWGLGAMAANHPDPPIRRAALRGFNKAIHQRSQRSRSMAFAALGAADVLVSDRRHQAALALLADTLTLIGPLPPGSWTWPEPRLTYANATLAEAVIAAGHALDSSVDLDRGLAMLDWLLELETTGGHLSVVGLGGRGPADSAPMYDQQPIEVAAMADACWRAADRHRRSILAARRCCRRTLVRRRERHRSADVRRQLWRRIRRVAARQRQPQPGRRVHPRLHLHDAARPVARADAVTWTISS